MEHLRPDIPVVGSNYPPSPFIQATCKVIRAGQFAGIGLVFAGDQIFSGIGMPAPAWYESVKSNKLPTSVMMWFLGNMVTQNLVSTGAFEVRDCCLGGIVDDVYGCTWSCLFVMVLPSFPLFLGRNGNAGLLRRPSHIFQAGGKSSF